MQGFMYTGALNDEIRMNLVQGAFSRARTGARNELIRRDKDIRDRIKAEQKRLRLPKDMPGEALEKLRGLQ